MAYLSLSGIEVRVSTERGLTQRPTYLGGKQRTFSGWAQSGVRSVVDTWSGGTPPLPVEEAQALRVLIEGQGHAWNFDAAGFDGLTSSKGLTATSYTTGGISVGSTTPGKFGAGLQLLPHSPLSEVRWNVGVPLHRNNVIAVWMRRPSILDGGWHHYLVDPEGDRSWLDGVPSFAAGDLAAEIGVVIEGYSDGGIRLGSNGGDGPADIINFDDLVVLPLPSVPDSWPRQMCEWGLHGNRFGRLPFHYMAGALVPGVAEVLGSVTEAASVEWSERGERVQGQRLEFELLQQPA
ncbi:hypothetical protein DRW03_21225 [Corallococcus sp. H22C18031201]|nr:hypothetical protein DRW03_21225 [Corallococcus sp. H22C18031201]